MLTFGVFMSRSVDVRHGEDAVNRLAGLAESRKDALENVISGWRERVLLIASRTQLRRSLADYNQSRSPAEVIRITQILEDAIGSVTTVASLAVYDADGRLVAAAGPGADSTLANLTRRAPADSADEVRFQGVSFTPDAQPQVGYLTDLILEDERVGALFVLLNCQELRDLTQNFIGLGDTGEVLIAMRDEGGAALTLHPLRHESVGGSGPTRLQGVDDPLVRALDRDEGVYSEGVVDYRGEPVWAATRYLPETGWGLVVKFDAAEQGASTTEFRKMMTNLGLSLAAFAILVGVVLGLRFAKPIHDLAETANRIRGGELDARAPVAREDEIGLLARTFNQMTDELEERMTLLNEFKKFFDVSLDMLCIAGTDGYFKLTNPAFERTLGWGSAELQSQPFYDLVHPDDVAATHHEIDKLAQGIPTISFVNRFRCADGVYKRLRWTSHPEPETGLLYAVAREISDPTAS